MGASKKATPLKLVNFYQESEEERDQAELSLEVEQAKLQLSADLLATEQALSRSKTDLNNALRSRPFSPQNIVDCEIKIEELEGGLNRLANLQKLF